jgi:hypothetical protein
VVPQNTMADEPAPPARPLTVEQVRANRQARATDHVWRDAYNRLQFGRGTEADWERLLPPHEQRRRMALRHRFPIGECVDVDGIASSLTHKGGTNVHHCVERVCLALAAVGLGGMPADGDIERVSNLELPGGYDPLTHEIWMDERWYRALEQFAGDPHRHANKGITFHALVHEHVHVNSPIHRNLRDAGYLDPAQVLIEEACVDSLARRVTERLLGHSIATHAYAPVVQTMTWLSERTGSDVAFAVWCQPTLAARIRRTSDAIAAALRVPAFEPREPSWVRRFRDLVAREHENLFLLIDAPDVLTRAGAELAAAHSRWGMLRLRMIPGDRSDLASIVARVLAQRREKRARALLTRQAHRAGRRASEL